MPGDDVDEIGECACHVRRCDADRVPTVHEPPAVGCRLWIGVRAREVQRQPRELGGGGHGLPGLHDPSRTRHHGARGAIVNGCPEDVEIPVGHRFVERKRSVERSDRIEVVGVMRRSSRFTQRQHRAAPEVEDRALALVDRADAQDGEPSRLAVAARAVVTERDDLRRRAQGVADPGGA